MMKEEWKTTELVLPYSSSLGFTVRGFGAFGPRTTQTLQTQTEGEPKPANNEGESLDYSRY